MICCASQYHGHAQSGWVHSQHVSKQHNGRRAAKKSAPLASYPLTIVESQYKDAELTALWNSLSDINNPILDDYLKIEKYLTFGHRPYLDLMFQRAIANGWISEDKLDRTSYACNRVLQRFKFVGSNGELPVKKILPIGGVSLKDRSRCIVMFSSFNYDGIFNSDGTYCKELYSTKMNIVIRELEEEGYKGHVLCYLGGYPMLAHGGLHLSHVPYSFKILSLIEASQIGYQDVLWIDTSVHPTNDLSEVFSTIEKNGYFLLTNGIAMKYDYDFGIIPDKTVKSCELSINDLSNMPHIIAGIMGISFRTPSQHDFLNEWYRLTAATWPAMSYYPEEFLVSVAAWKTHKAVTDNVGNKMSTRSQIPTKPAQSDKPFWHDKS
jgi:hypothetical protein